MLHHTFQFHQPISVERAPEGHLCEWCSELAAYRLTAIGGIHHNQGGFFCQECGEEFARAVSKSMRRITTADPIQALPMFQGSCINCQSCFIARILVECSRTDA